MKGTREAKWLFNKSIANHLKTDIYDRALRLQEINDRRAECFDEDMPPEIVSQISLGALLAEKKDLMAGFVAEPDKLDLMMNEFLSMQH